VRQVASEGRGHETPRDAVLQVRYRVTAPAAEVVIGLCKGFRGRWLGLLLLEECDRRLAGKDGRLCDMRILIFSLFSRRLSSRLSSN